MDRTVAHPNVLTRMRAFALASACALAVLAPAAHADDLASSLRVHGLLDIVMHTDDEGVAANTFIPGDGAFAPYRLRLFFDGQASDQVQVFAQLLATEMGGVTVDGAYAMVTPWQEKDLHLVAGKIAWPIGTWAPRTYSDKNPLIGIPMLYQYHTSLRWDAVPGGVDALLAGAGHGANSPNYGGYAGAPGMPLVEDYRWDFGAAINGAIRPLEFAAGVTNSAPSWAGPVEDPNRGKAVMGRIGLAPLPDVRFGVSAAQGAYLARGVSSLVPPGEEGDFMQTLLMADGEIQRGHLELRSEAAWNAWETKTVGTLHVHGGYIEGRWTFGNGVWLASRAEMLRFAKITGSDGPRPWDDDVDRYETGIGVKVARNVLVKAVWQREMLHEFDEGTVEPYDFFGSQLAIKF